MIHSDWCELHGCLRMSCNQRGAHRAGEPVDEDEVGDSSPAPEAPDLDTIRAWVEDDNVCHAPPSRERFRLLLRLLDKQFVRAAVARASSKHWAAECDRLRAENARLKKK